MIPAFNSETTVRTAIASAFTAGAAVVYVIDDGSSDETAQRAREAGATVHSQPNQGAAASRRGGIELVTAPFVVLLDADDQLVRKGVERSLRELMRGSEFSGAAGAAIGFVEGRADVAIRPERGIASAADLVRKGYSPVPPACFVWRTTGLKFAMSTYGVPQLSPKYAEDFELAVRASMSGGPILVHSEVSARYSLAGGKSTVAPDRSIRASSEIRSHYSKFLDLEVAEWSERNIRARVLLRQSKEARSLIGRIVLVFRSATLDSRLVLGPLARRLRDSRA
ncbi:glycosyltransferase family A protein [Salinibacterium sp. G-O1]|nr:glycosyltransferase family A protein [Salinibacterium sp. G-O1]MDJ0335416.1 glycosyltransferase family A protein [Salinibacterium sp. G-O1]